jgi:hypothetical protein
MKDPAFLFYPNDYLGGTLGMTFEEKGAYMELLMMQFNRGHMTSHMIGQTVGQIWVNIQDKFKVDPQGLFYNERLEMEQEKRKTFTSSRKNNLLGKNQHTKNDKKVGHMTSHMENENENENRNINKDENLLNNNSIISVVCRNWYNKFTTYTKDQDQDYKAINNIIQFMVRQHSMTDIDSNTDRALIITTMEQIAAVVEKDQFWANKPLKSIANNIQEFYNNIKNPKHGKIDISQPGRIREPL